METMNNYNGVILIIDLETQQCDTEDLSEELVEKALGGAAINMELYEQYKDRDPLILGSGFFTATFMPLGCTGVITAKSPMTGKIAHVPFGWQTGVELKLTGFDFVVLLGKAANPVRLWLHDGLSDIDDSTDLWGKDTWECTDKLREDYGDDMIQSFVIGKAGENKNPLAMVSENYWGSKDRAGLGAVFGEKNVKAIAMRGLGAIEVAEGFFQKCVDLKNKITNGTIKGKTGLADIATDMGVDTAVIEKLKSMTHRNNAAFNCPYPYYTFLKYREAPDAMAMEGVAEPGCMVSDISAFAALHEAGLDAPQAMEKCCRLGLNPAAAGKVLKGQGAADLSALDKLAEEGTADPSDTTAFSSAVPAKLIFASQPEGENEWMHKQAMAYVLGLDPVIMLMCPEITDENLAELIQLSGECDDFSVDALKKITAELVEKSK